MKCLYCKGTEFYEGPSGGLSINVLCANPECRHWFNYNLLTELEDLHRVEPTKEEKQQVKTDQITKMKHDQNERFEEGKIAFIENRELKNTAC